MIGKAISHLRDKDPEIVTLLNHFKIDDLNIETITPKISFRVNPGNNMNDFSNWIEAISTEESRSSMIEKGLHHAELFLSYVEK